MSDGKVIRLVFPRLTEERRRELTKLGGKMLETTRVAMRNVRRDTNEKLKKMEKEKALSKDEAFRLQEEVQKTTDRYIGIAEGIYAEKEKEILEI
jgi:ribosome recycling factor